MVEIKNKEHCNGCSSCAASCPKKCITMVRDKLGFFYPMVDKDACVHCGLCISVCPEQKKAQPVTVTPLAYAAIGKEHTIREKSSSGGVFTLIAQWILSKGGVVFGAAFDDTAHSVNHIAIESLEELHKLQGSKYLQSKIGNSFEKVKSYLEQGRTVLFSGTPCQIAGLKSFLKKDYERLYLQDIACHGVPAPAVWDAYLTDLEHQFGGKASRVSFRDKRKSWKKYLLRIEFENGNVYSNNNAEDLYMRGFLHDCYLRPSCYACKHKGLGRDSDITLADYWGIEQIHPELDDDQGTSLVIVSSPKGEELLQQIADEISLTPTDLNRAIEYNTALITAAKDNPARKKFENEFQKKPLRSLLKKYASTSFFKKLKRKIKRFLKL